MPESRTLDLAAVSETNGNVVTSTLDFEPLQGTAATTELQLTEGMHLVLRSNDRYGKGFRSADCRFLPTLIPLESNALLIGDAEHPQNRFLLLYDPLFRQWSLAEFQASLSLFCSPAGGDHRGGGARHSRSHPAGRLAARAEEKEQEPGAER